MSHPGPDPARGSLDARVLAWIRDGSFEPDEARFELVRSFGDELRLYRRVTR